MVRETPSPQRASAADRTDRPAPLPRRSSDNGFAGPAAVIAVAAAVTAIVAHGPSTTLAHAQLHHAGAIISVARGGDWFLPRCPTRGLYRKPPLAIWAGATVVKATGVTNDFILRLPTVLAFFAVAFMVYRMGRRWYSPRVGILAACLWATSLHMTKVSYMALTDMMFAACVTASILCADRLLWHCQGVHRRWAWATAFWAAMILGAMTKGWGLVNAALVGGTIALAAGLGPGFRMPRGLKGVGKKAGAAVRLVLRRWRAAARAVYLPRGLAAMLAVMGPLIAAMFLFGGQEFQDVVYKEVWQRLTGGGEAPPLSPTVPAVFQLLYFQFPASVFAVGALLLARRRDWFSHRALLVPASWVVAVLMPFALAHGFRPDYLLPCYPAVALVGAWAVDRLARMPFACRRRWSLLRHAFASAPVILGVVLVAVPAAYAAGAYGGGTLRDAFRDPRTLDAVTRWGVVATAVAGIVLTVLAVHASLAWRIARLAALAVLGSVGLIFLYTHTLSSHAKQLEGERVVRFTREARRIAHGGPIVLCGAEFAGVHLYLAPSQWQPVGLSELVPGRGPAPAPWLIITDAALDAAAPIAARTRSGEEQVGETPHSALRPEDLGRVCLRTDEPIMAREVGNLYLVELGEPTDSRGPTPAPRAAASRAGGEPPATEGRPGA